MTARSLLIRGMLVGVVAAALAFVFATVFGEPQVDRAIAVEAGHETSGTVVPVLVDRSVQATWGLGIATAVYGAALGGIFGLAFAFAYGRLGRLTARGTALLVAGVGFVAVFLVPYLKYPANPPAIGRSDTIGQRTALYFTMMLISVAAAIGAVLVARRLVPRLGAWYAVLAVTGGFLAVVLLAGQVLHRVDEVPADFPATLLWRFRLASLGMQAVLWATFGLLFGELTERSLRRQARPEATAVE
jgi:hypothetical protein